MAVNSVLTGYVGGKGSLHWKIRAFFDPKCTEYIEPYAGGAAVYFSIPNYQYQKEWLNDRNPNIALMYYAIADPDTRTETVQRILDLEKPDDKNKAKRQFEAASKRLLDPNCYNITEKMKNMDKDTMISIAVATYLVYTQSFNKTGKGYSDLMSNLDYMGTTEQNIMKSANRLKTIRKVTNIDSLEIVKAKKEDEKTQLYLDPPYIGVCRANKGKNYAVDMSSLQSHYELASAIRDAKAAVVLSGYRAPQEEVPTIYDAVLDDDWHCYAIGDVKNNAVISSKGDKKPDVTEYIWTNRVPEGAEYEVILDDCKERITMKSYLHYINNAINDGRITNKKDIQDYRRFEEYMKEI